MLIHFSQQNLKNCIVDVIKECFFLITNQQEQHKVVAFLAELATPVLNWPYIQYRIAVGPVSTHSFLPHPPDKRFYFNRERITACYHILLAVAYLLV